MSRKVSRQETCNISLPLMYSIVRTTRARIIRLRNDYKSLMKKIEEGLHSHHAQARAMSSTVTPAHASPSISTSPGGSGEVASNSVEAPFAKVNSVVEGSPAATAGLRVGDQIKRFGNIDWMNNEKLSKIADIVQRNEGVFSRCLKKCSDLVADGSRRTSR